MNYFQSVMEQTRDGSGRYGPKSSPSGLGPVEWLGVCPRCMRRNRFGAVIPSGVAMEVPITCDSCGLKFSEIYEGPNP